MNGTLCCVLFIDEVVKPSIGPVTVTLGETGSMEGFTTSSLNSTQQSVPFKDDISDEEIQKAILEIQDAIKKAPK